MEVVLTPTPAVAARLAADVIADLVRRRPRPVLGLATGSSPLGVYDELGRRVRQGELSLAGVRAFLLDEYVGLRAGHPQAYREVISRELLEQVDLDPRDVRSPDGSAADLPAECAAYERAIADAGGIDVQLLGIGSDGHVAFNEPGSSLASRTRVKTLTDQTRRDNARFFDDDPDAVPRHCLTQGIGTILEARHLLLLASGPGKAEAVAQMVEGPVSAAWPATALQLHPHATVLLDEEAAAGLRRREHYRETWAHKPDWQRL